MTTFLEGNGSVPGPTSASIADRLASLRDLDKAHLWHPFTALADWEASDSLVIERGEGLDLIDVEGNRYLDGSSSLWCVMHGHAHPTIVEAIREQATQLCHATLLGTTHPPAIELAHELARRAPGDLDVAFFSSDGASAIEVALKMAFQYWHQKDDPEPARTKFLALEEAYHGDTLGDVSVGGVAEFHAMFKPLLFEVLRAPSPCPYRSAFGPDPDRVRGACLERVDSLLREHAGTVAAVVLEPLVQGAAGIWTHVPGFLSGVADLCKEHDTLLIADEVAVGFGRTGTLFACEQEDVVPDFLCLGKGLTGGYLPMSATLTSPRIRAAFRGDRHDPKTFYHGHTFAGNPLAAAAALANLRVLDEERTLERMRPASDRLGERLEELRGHPNVGDVRRRGLMAGVELVADRASKARFPFAERRARSVCRHAQDHGVLIRPLDDVVILMPPLTIDPAGIDRLVGALAAGLDREFGTEAGGAGKVDS